MKKRANLKRIIIVLCVFLCTEACTFIYLVTSGDNKYSRNLNLGNKYILSEDYDDAIKAFTKAIAIDEKKEDAYIGRGDAYKAKGDYASAWEDYEKAQELSGDSNLIRDRIGATDIAVVDENGQGIDGATVRLEGNSHSYEFVTDSTGHIIEPIFPEKYSAKAVKDENESIETEISAEGGGFVANPIQLGVGSDTDQDVLQNTVDVIEEYKDFIKSQNDGSEYLNYLIYDIDKDSYPEVMMERMISGERRSDYDLYTYEHGSFSFVGTLDSMYPHSPEELASYPNGNGMVSSYSFRELEFVDIVTFYNGKIEKESIYERKVEDNEDWKYYRDKFDQTYQDSQAYKAYINHQYYRSETSSPYFEGSYLLAQSAMDDFTAVYEAFGINEETGKYIQE